MMNYADYPVGANEDPNAPWHEKELPSIEKKVCISVTLSKTVKIKVNDYKEVIDSSEDGNNKIIDFSSCNLYKAVEEQINLPQEEFRNWNVDEYEIILE